MLKFYYSRASSAIAAHILLCEVDARFDAIEVSIPDKEHLSPAFLARNPKGRIPVLETSEGVLTENPAILEYIAALHPEAGYMPKGHFQQAQARSLCAYLCATAHVAFAHRHRGARWARNEASLQDMARQVPQNIAACANYLETHLALNPWALGADHSFCDPYLFMFAQWLSVAEVAIEDYPKLKAHRTRMRARPATQTVLALHGLA